MTTGARDHRVLNTLAKGLAVLRHVESSSWPATTTEIATAIGMHRVSVLRLLRTLEREGFLQRDAGRRYRAVSRRPIRRIGYCAPLAGNVFRRTIAESLQRAAAGASLHLTVLDNPDDDARAARRSAELLVDVGVGVAIVFQPQRRVAHGLADVLQRAGIPFISVDSPVPGGFYFGANNFEAGRLAGGALAEFARRHWQGRCHRVVLVEAHLASHDVEARFSGALAGVREVLPGFPEERVQHVDGQGQRATSAMVFREVLESHRPGTKMLVSCFNDLSALGALDAVRALHRERDVAIVGQNAAADVHRELADPSSPLVASVAYFPERYGERLVQLCERVLQGDAVPPAVLVEHVVLTRENWREYYPDASA
jgi:ribose transport system substrate-binding protein